jgi:hypothetical protein
MLGALAPSTDVVMASIQAAAGNYLSSLVILTCPTGTSNVASGAALSSCTDIAAGFALTPGVHTLVSDITSCTLPGTYCPGFVGAGLNLTTPTDLTSFTAVNGTYSSSAVTMTCPAGTTNNASGTSIAVCKDLAPGYALTVGVHTRLSDIVRALVMDIAAWLLVFTVYSRALSILLFAGAVHDRSWHVLPRDPPGSLAVVTDHYDNIHRICWRLQRQRCSSDLPCWDDQRRKRCQHRRLH